MSNQNKFLLAATSAASTNRQAAGGPSSGSNTATTIANNTPADLSDQENQLSVDEDFDSYWEEEARNPNRNRIRIGRQYQATVPPLLRPGEKDSRKLEELETLSFCPKKSAKVSDTELSHYFTVAKSLHLFASLVETRSLLGRDVTIADLNHIRQKEGLSLASVIQPVRQAAVVAAAAISSGSASAAQQQSSNSPNNANPSAAANAAASTPIATTTPTITTTTATTTITNADEDQPSSANCDKLNNSQAISTTSASTRDQPSSSSGSSGGNNDNSNPTDVQAALNQPLMKALSHFISLHHPCKHDRDCKKLHRSMPLDDSLPTISMPAGNLRQGSSSAAVTALKDCKPGRSRSSLKQVAPQASPATTKDEPGCSTSDREPLDREDPQAAATGDSAASYEDWTREEVELFSRAIEVCGKNFSNIKKEFLPSKSVKSIVEYYYIGSREDNSKRKSTAVTETSADGCSCPEKSQTSNNNGHGGPSGGGRGGGGGPGGHINNSPSSSAGTSSGRIAPASKADPNAPPSTTTPSDETKLKSSVSPASSDVSKSNGTPNNTPSSKTKANFDSRMSVYNFDEDFKDESSANLECSKPGTEVKPLKAKPIVPNAFNEADPNNDNLGSLKFFMDGQLVLKLNAKEQLEGGEKCHWVQSGDKIAAANRQRRFTKRADRSESSLNCSQTGSVVSSCMDDDSKTCGTNDEDSKESINSLANTSQSAKALSSNRSPTPKRLKSKGDSASNNPSSQPQPQPAAQQLTSPINYNRLAVNNRMKEKGGDQINNLSTTPSGLLNTANIQSNVAPPLNIGSGVGVPLGSGPLPWLPANNLAMANNLAAFFGSLNFQPAAPLTEHGFDPSNQSAVMNNLNVNAFVSKPMDLSLEHSPAKTSIAKSSSRSRSGKAKNSS